MYKNINKKDIITRDLLAIDRTILANERTFLSYIRTALTFFISGITFIKFFGEGTVKIMGYFFVPAGIIFFIIGIIDFIKKKEELKKIIK